MGSKFQVRLVVSVSDVCMFVLTIIILFVLLVEVLAVC